MNLELKTKTTFKYQIKTICILKFSLDLEPSYDYNSTPPLPPLCNSAFHHHTLPSPPLSLLQAQSPDFAITSLHAYNAQFTRPLYSLPIVFCIYAQSVT